MTPPVLGAALVAVVLLAAPAAAQTVDVQAVLAELGRLPALQGLRLEGATPLAQGKTAYGVRLGSRSLPATILGTPGGGGRPTWSVAVGTGALSFASLLPAQAQALGDVALGAALVVVAAADHDLVLADLPPDLQRQVAGLPGLPSRTRLALRAGVNFFGSVQLSRSGVLGEMKQHLGLASEAATLHGVVGADVLQVLGNGAAVRAGDSLGTLELTAILGRIAPPPLRGVLESDDLTVTFKGDGQAIGATGSTRLGLTLPGQARIDVPVTLSLSRAPPDRGSYFRLTGSLPSTQLAGLPHLPHVTLDALTLDIALIRRDTRRVPFFGVVGHGHLGAAPVKLVGALAPGKTGAAELTVWLDGEVRLADVVATGSVPGLDQVTVTQASFAQGQIAARARVGGKAVTVVAWVPPGKRLPNVVIGTGGIGLADFVPAARGTALDALSLRTGAFFMVPKDNAATGVRAAALPDLAVQLLGGPQGEALGAGLDLTPGLNLFGSLHVGGSPSLKPLLDAVGTSLATLPIRGTLDPALFTHTPWQRARGDGAAPASGTAGSLTESFLSHLKLELPLPGLRPPGAGQALAFRPGTLAITGSADGVAVAITTGADIRLADRTLSIAALHVRRAADGAIRLDGAITGSSAGDDPRQLTTAHGLHVTALDLDATIDAQQRLSARLVGKGTVALHAGPKDVAIEVLLGGGAPAAEVDITTALTVDDFVRGGVPGLGKLAFTRLTLSPAWVAGTVRFRNEDTTLVLFTVAGQTRPAVALVHDRFRLADYVSQVAGTPLADVELDRAVALVMPGGGGDVSGVGPAALPDRLVTALGGPRAALFPLDLRAGANVFGTVGLARHQGLGDWLRSLGVNATELPLRGVIDPALFAAAASRPGALLPPEIALDLPELRPPGAASHLRFGRSRFRLTRNADGSGRLAIATSVQLTLDPRHVLTAEGEFTRTTAAGGAAVLTFAAKEKLALPAPFGLAWLDLEEVDIGATIDRGRGTVDAVLGARARIARQRYTVTAHLVVQDGVLQDVVLGLTGKIPLAAIPGVGTIPGLSGVVLVDPEVSRTHVAGGIELWKTSFRVALLEHDGAWDLVLQHGPLALDAVLPALGRTPLAGVTLPKGLLVLSASGLRRPVASFPAPLQPALADLGFRPDATLETGAGLNLVSTLDPARLSGAFRKALDALGVKAPVVLSGGIGGVFGGQPALTLQAGLPQAPALPVKALRPRPGQTGSSLRLGLVGEQVTVGIGAGVNFRVGRDDLTFDASLNASFSADSVVLDVQGRLLGAWHDPVGLKGVTLEDVSLTLGVNETGAIVLSLGGKARLAKRDVLVAAGASLLPEALGAPEAIAFVGQIDRLSLADIAEVAGTLVRTATGGELGADALPGRDVVLENVTFALMTPGAYIDPLLMRDAKLEITGAGVALAGALVVDGKRLGSLSGFASDQGLGFTGDVAPFHLGPVALDRASVDIKAALGAAPHFRLATRARPFGPSAFDLDVTLDKSGFSFVADQQVGGHYTASIRARTTKGFTLSRDNDLELHAKLGPDFVAFLRAQIRQALEAGFAELDHDAAQARQRLDEARTALGKAEAAEAAERRAALARAAGVAHTVDEAQASVTAAERRVRSLDDDIRREHAAAAAALRRARLGQAGEHKGREAALRAEQAGAQAALEVARKVLAAARAGTALPPEADPLLLAAVTALGVARGAVQVATDVVTAAENVSRDLRAAAERLTDPAVLDVRSATLDGTLATGAALALEVRVFGGQPVSVRAAYKMDDVKAVLASLGQAAGELATHLRGHKTADHAPAPPPAGDPGTAPPPPPGPTVPTLTFDGGKYAIPVAQCGSACPLPPASCKATWPWADKDRYPPEQPRPAGAGPCPAEPAGGCIQLVIGPQEATDRYKGCRGYVVLDPSDAAPEKNDEYVACAIAGRAGTSCSPPILVGAGWSKIAPASSTARALCQLQSCKWSVTLHQDQPGTATAVEGTLAFDGGRLQIPRSACVNHCPQPPASCAGPWSNQAPDPHARAPRETARPDPADCPAPPRDPDGTECTQVVLGRLADVEKYRGCRGYVVLNRSDWEIERNDEFIACAAAGRLGATCRTPIAIMSGWDHIQPTTVTAREMCQLRTCQWDVELREHGPGRAGPAGSAAGWTPLPATGSGAAAATR